MKYSVLDMVQLILEAADSDEVNSIGDTQESRAVANILKQVYDDIVSRADLPVQKLLFNLDPSTDPTKPVLMFKPQTISTIEWLKYDCRRDTPNDPAFMDICFLPLWDFLNLTYGFRASDDDVGTMQLTSGTTSLTFFHRSNKMPQYWTTYDDNSVIFDSYDITVDTTLQASKTVVFGEMSTTWLNEDTFIPHLQDNQFSLLLNEAKSLYWTEKKQGPHPKAEQMAHKNWVHLQKSRGNTPDDPSMDWPDYGRTSAYTRIPRRLRSAQ